MNATARILRTVTPLLVVIAAATLVACSSGEVVEDETPQDGQRNTSLTDDQAHAAAEAMLLTLEDLPLGWKQLPADTDEEPPAPELIGECADLNLDDSAAPGQMAQSESREFASPDEDVEAQFSGEVFENDAAAAATFATTQRFLGECRAQFEQAFMDALKTELEKRQSESEDPLSEPLSFEQPLDMEVKSFGVSGVEFGGFGDESVAMRLATTFVVGDKDFATYIDLIGIRLGNLLTSFSYQTSIQTPDLAGEREFAALLDARARGVAASLRGEGDELPPASASFTSDGATAAASDAILTGDDLPADWTSVEHDRDFADNLLKSLAGANLPDLPTECQLLIDIHLGRTDRGVAEVWSDGFLGREIGTVDSSVAVFANEDDAKQAVEQVRTLAEKCPEPIKQWWSALSEVSQGGPVEVTHYELAEHSFDSFGDESFALRMAIVAVGPDEDDVTKDIAVVRVGNVVGLLHYTSSWGEPPPDRALEERLLGTIEDRISQAADSLQ
jgi:hypothetical protein